MRFAYLGSGSRGNAAVIECGGSRLLLDCGFSIKETTKRLNRLGLTPSDLDAVLVTHEHSDHISGVGPLARRFGLKVFMTSGTFASGKTGDLPDLKVLSFRKPLQLGDLSVQPVRVPHDAREPCQFVFSGAQKQLGILTDVGHITPHIIEQFSGCDALVLECNHDAQMLAKGPYPAGLKLRVGGKYGHLNNQQAAQFLRHVDHTGLQHVLAVHISEKNNTRELALDALRGVLADIDQRSGAAAERLDVACQTEGAPWREIV